MTDSMRRPPLLLPDELANLRREMTASSAWMKSELARRRNCEIKEALLACNDELAGLRARYDYAPTQPRLIDSRVKISPETDFLNAKVKCKPFKS